MDKFLKLIFMFALLASCVGTVEEKNPERTKGSAESTAPLLFQGITSAVAIADDKVDVYFIPADGDQSKLHYLISYDGLENPISVPANVLTQDKGKLKYTVRGLSIGSTYSFGVQVQDSNGRRSEAVNIRTESTFDYITANYDGVMSANALPGVDGKNSISVNWVEAVISGLGPDVDPRDDDPIEYEITIVDANKIDADDFDNEAFSFPDRRVISTPADKASIQINGLSPGVKYNVRVRCIHRGYIDNNIVTGESYELNSNYTTVTTLSETAGSISINHDSLDIRPASGASGKTTLHALWAPVGGPVDHFRVYYRKFTDITTPWNTFKGVSRSSNCAGAESDNFYCSRGSGDKVEAFLTDLDINTDYEVYVLACGSIVCAEGEYQVFTESIGKYYQTEAIPANFTGVTSLSGPTHHLALDKAYVGFSPPDLSTGATDGILVTIQILNLDGSINQEYDLNSPETVVDTQGMGIEPFDYSQDTQIVLTGIDTVTTQNHCVKLTPYIDRGLSGYEYVTSKASSICANLKFSIPVNTDFNGLDLVASQYLAISDLINLSWVKPTAGIYDRYRIFIYYNGAGYPSGFNFTDAINGAANYHMYEVDLNATNFSLGPIPSGTYEIAIIPYLGVTGEYQIGFNSNLYRFTKP